MPFDGKDFPLIAVPVVKPFDFDTASPDERLLELARWLEDEQAWRDKIIVWDYLYVEQPTTAHCGTAGCALGLASKVWPGFASFEAYDVFDMAEADGQSVFFGLEVHRFYGVDLMSKVTPGMVATAIREFVAART